MVVRVGGQEKNGSNQYWNVRNVFILVILIAFVQVPSALRTQGYSQDYFQSLAYADIPSIRQLTPSQSTIDRISNYTWSTQSIWSQITTDDASNISTSARQDPKVSTTIQSTSNSKEPYDNPRTDFLIHVPHFEKQEGVAIVTQIHGPHQYGLLKQSFCLLQKAYNSKMLYDYIVFLAEPLSDEQVEEMNKIVFPANLTFVSNAPNGLHGLINDLTPERKDYFLKRCDNPDMYNITWFSRCPVRLAYNWQAEFRSWRVWTQPALANYKYMFWLDSDMFATQVWKQDPIAYMVAHDLVVLFAHLGGGNAKGNEVDKIKEFYGKSFCDLRLTDHGFLHAPTGPDCRPTFPAVHGFFHITNLDFYRSHEVQGFLTNFRQDCFLCRDYDDQVAVTIPAAMLAPNRSKDMRRSGLILNNYHNAYFDGQIQAKPAGFKAWFRKYGGSNFTEAKGVCRITEAG